MATKLHRETDTRFIKRGNKLRRMKPYRTYQEFFVSKDGFYLRTVYSFKFSFPTIKIEKVVPSLAQSLSQVKLNFRS